MLRPLPRNPRLYEINTRVWLLEHGWKSLAAVPDRILDGWAERFDVVWLMGVWLPSIEGRRLAQSHSGLAGEIRRALPNVTKEDVVSSPYAVMGYRVGSALGGDAAMAAFRRRMRDRGLRLMLDLVPNHVARDHPWVSAHPGRFVQGNDLDIANSPQNFFRAKTKSGLKIFAHGRDPYFDGWQDTVQIDIFLPGTRRAMIDLIMDIAGMCDCVRCDMAMLLLNGIFKNTWKNRVGDSPSAEFWREAVSAVKRRHPEFIFLGEVYWDLEREMQQVGFDFTYDIKLYDLLRREDTILARHHLNAAAEHQAKSARMIENHDELRAAAVFDGPKSRAAAVLTYAVPGLRFFHEGQLEGRRVKVPVQLRRRMAEPADHDIAGFYEKLLNAISDPVLLNGNCRMLEPAHERMFAFWWWLDSDCRLAVVNFAPDPSQTRVRVPHPFDPGTILRFKDLLSDRIYDRDSREVSEQGMYFDMPGYDVHFFHVSLFPSS